MACLILGFRVIAGAAAKALATWSVRTGPVTTWFCGSHLSLTVFFVALSLALELVR